ncbi:SURF1 family protein [Methylobacterium sp. A54F]
MSQPPSDVRPPRRAAALALAGACLLAACAFLALGIWQVERRAWKLDLIARVEARIHAPAAPAPPPAEWTRIKAAQDPYRHVAAAGTYLRDADTLVQAVTELGAGFWVLTPLRDTRGFTLLINRGFVPAERRDPAAREPPAGEVSVTGLLRLTEPGGAFLRANDPGAGRWYSRDVAAIAAARGLPEAAPYFVDADATPAGALPVGGLTIVAFRNDHLVYALTWFALAAMSGAGALYLLRDLLPRDLRGRRSNP